MEHKIRGFVVFAGVLGALFVGAGFEHARQLFVHPKDVPSDSEAVKPTATPTVRTIVVTNDAAARAANEALRKRVAELEQALSARAAEPPPVAEAPADGAPREERPRRQSFTERLEQMKKENPEQYAEMQKRREEFRQTMEQRAQDRANFVSSVETQNMTDEQKANHEKLLETVARVNELMAQMGQADGENGADLRRQMGEAMHSLGELYGSERRFLFEETARAVGYEGDQVSAFADQMQTIIDNTTMSGFGRHGWHGNTAAPASDGAPAAAQGTH